MSIEIYPPTQRLLELPDQHGALLAEFDFFAEYQTLRVRWHGHLTATSIVQGTQAGMALRHNGVAPCRILNDKTRTSGDWSEALPWLQYDWLPLAATNGLQAIAFLPSQDASSQTGDRELMTAMRQQVQLGIFHSEAQAWQWLARRGRPALF